MRIAETSNITGLSVDTLRFYEKEGLITPARSSGQRIYSERDLDELDTIARLRRLGISIPEIRSLLEIDRQITDISVLTPETIAQIDDVQSLLTRHSRNLEARISEMQSTLSAFQKMTSKLQTLLQAGGTGHDNQDFADHDSDDLRVALDHRSSSGDI